jgi:hypothetical protein
MLNAFMHNASKVSRARLDFAPLRGAVGHRPAIRSSGRVYRKRSSRRAARRPNVPVMAVVRTARSGHITAGTAASGTLGIVGGDGHPPVMNNADHHNLMAARDGLAVLPAVGNLRNARQKRRNAGSKGLTRPTTALSDTGSRHKVALMRVTHDRRGARPYRRGARPFPCALGRVPGRSRARDRLVAD